MGTRYTLYLIAVQLLLGVLAADASPDLHPLNDATPLKLEMTKSQLEISEKNPGAGTPISVSLRPKEGSWDCSNKLWLLLDVQNNEKKSVLVRAEVSSVKKKGWGVNKGGINVPAGETRTLPILIMRGMVEGRDGEALKTIFNDMRGYPGGHQQTGWRQIDASAVNKIKLEFFSDATRVECKVSNLRAATRFQLPSDSELKGKYTPATDTFGQNRNTDWKFKIKSESDFAKRLASEEAWLEKFHTLENRSRFGGWTGGGCFPATGHFSTAEKDGRWWLVDPEGWPFWSIGATGINLKLGFTKTPGIGKWNPRRSNLELKFGEDWEVKASELTHGRLKAWGMNTLGNWSDSDFYLMQKTPYTVAVHCRRAVIPEKGDAHKALPDVFHPDFEKNIFDSVARFDREAIDPWCLGYFIDNELSFSQATTPAGKTLEAPADCHSRIELLRQLKEKYETIERLNAAWSADFSDWKSVRAPQGKWAPARGEDLLAFSEAWYHKYFKTCRDAMRKHAPNKLYLGSRINHTKNKTVLSICAEYADVVSINFYDYTPDVFKAPEGFNAPVMIGEFHFGTITERGVWGGGLCTGMDIQHSADLFENYVTEALKNPLIVGAHWFKFSDQPLTGRTDGENYRIGFVDVADTPYPEMVKACRRVAETMYPLRAEINLSKDK
jgi:hypothetical protein